MSKVRIGSHLQIDKEVIWKVHQKLVHQIKCTMQKWYDNYNWIEDLWEYFGGYCNNYQCGKKNTLDDFNGILRSPDRG